MATDFSDLGETIGDAFGRVAREAMHTASRNGQGPRTRTMEGALSGTRGVAAGAALAAAAPYVAKGAVRVVRGTVVKRLASSGDGGADLTGKLTDGVKDTVRKIGEAGAAGVAKKAGKSVLPGGGGGDEKGEKGTPGVGKGRRMAVQQAVDVAVPLSTAYNQWTQFEEWPRFMHRLDQAMQEDDRNITFKAKIWGISREFEAQIVEQRPDERIMWTATKGVTHTGVVTFHELADRLTRVQVTLDVQPGSLLEAARGMRHLKRAVRADLARFTAFIEVQEVETGAWRGVIRDGELVEEHDPNYDRRREYADFDDIYDPEHSHAPQQRTGTGSSRSSRGSSRSSSSGRGRSGQSSRSRSRSSSSGRSRSSSSGRNRSSTSARNSSGGRQSSRSGSSSGRSRSRSRSGGRRSSSQS